MNKKGFTMAVAISILLTSVSALALDDVESKLHDIESKFRNHLASSAFALGRTKACGANIEESLLRLGRLLGRQPSLGSNTDDRYLQLAIEGVQRGEESQKSGKGPDNCSTILRMYEDIRHLPQ